MKKSPSKQAHDERGQATMEAAIALPIVLLIVFAIINFAIVWNHYETLTDAVRAAARAASTCRFGGNAGAAFSAAATDLDASKRTFTTVPPTCPGAGLSITATGTYPYSINVMGLVVKSGTLSSSSTVTVE